MIKNIGPMSSEWLASVAIQTLNDAAQVTPLRFLSGMLRKELARASALRFA